MDTEKLFKQSQQIRRDILEMICEAKSGHPGGSLSCVEILTSLYFTGVLNHDPKNPNMLDRDRFILCKGHAAPALYSVLSRCGYFSGEHLMTLRKVGSILQGHPDSSLVSGVEISTGSLGQGLSIASGIACGLELKGLDSYVYALLGDGECQEGQVWEAATFAAHKNLSRLIAIVDANGLQIDGACEDVCESANLGTKFEAFGWNVFYVDGHNIEMLVDTFNLIKQSSFRGPSVVIASTIKGKGVSFMQNKASWHGNAPSKEQLIVALSDIDTMGVGND